MIRIEDVTKRYGDVTALDGIDLEIDRGESVGLVGPNGAGKTTLIRLLAGHADPDEGTVRVGGMDPGASPRIRQRVGYLPDHGDFRAPFSGREVLDFHARVRGIDDRSRRVERVLETVGLRGAADRRVGTYSNGMTRRLALGTTLLFSPDVLLLDEPTAGLDPEGVAAFNGVVERIRDGTDVTVLLTTHILDEVERLCERVVVVDGGTVRADGDIDEVRRSTDHPVEVRARVPDPEAAIETLRNALPAGASVDAEPRRGRVTVSCAPEDVFAVVERVGELDADHLEVEQPWLGAFFQPTTYGGEHA